MVINGMAGITYAYKISKGRDTDGGVTLSDRVPVSLTPSGSDRDGGGRPASLSRYVALRCSPHSPDNCNPSRHQHYYGFRHSDARPTIPEAQAPLTHRL